MFVGKIKLGGPVKILIFLIVKKNIYHVKMDTVWGLDLGLFVLYFI